MILKDIVIQIRNMQLNVHLLKGKNISYLGDTISDDSVLSAQNQILPPKHLDYNNLILYLFIYLFQYIYTG